MEKEGMSEAECALHILTKAEEIKANPKLMDEVKALAKKQAPIIKSIADIKAKYNEMVEDEDEGESEGAEDESESEGESSLKKDHEGAPIKKEPKMKVFEPDTYDAKTYKKAEV